MNSCSSLLFSMIIHCKNGLLSCSSPMVVKGPWPGNTTVSSGNGKRYCAIELNNVSVSPPGKSVLPILPANNVSPTKAHECRKLVIESKERLNYICDLVNKPPANHTSSYRRRSAICLYASGMSLANTQTA